MPSPDKDIARAVRDTVLLGGAIADDQGADAVVPKDRQQALRLLPDARLRLFRAIKGGKPARAGNAFGNVR